jgi:hypothetical protein
MAATGTAAGGIQCPIHCYPLRPTLLHAVEPSYRSSSISIWPIKNIALQSQTCPVMYVSINNRVFSFTRSGLSLSFHRTGSLRPRHRPGVDASCQQRCDRRRRRRRWQGCSRAAPGQHRRRRLSACVGVPSQQRRPALGWRCRSWRAGARSRQSQQPVWARLLVLRADTASRQPHSARRSTHQAALTPELVCVMPWRPLITFPS